MGAWSGHYIVCGGNSLAYRLVAELVEHYEVPVVAIVPDRERGHAPRIEQLPGVTAVVAFGTVTDEALRAVNIGAARGIALVEGDDQSNIHTALAAQGRNPDLRIVLRMFNQRLGEQIEKLLRNCTALSGSATAASAFANAALQRPNSVQVGGEFLCVTYEQQVPQDHLCVAADRIDPQDLSRIRLLPEVPGPAAGFDPQEPTIPKRVQRGGSFLCSDTYCVGYRVTSRMKGDPKTATFHCGFRCVKR